MPVPSRFNNFFKVIVARFPAENFFCFFARSNKLCRVAGTSSCNLRRYRMTCNFSCGFDNFLYCKPYAVPEVENVTFIAFHKVLHRKYMCIRKVRYMNIVTHTSPVLCWIVFTKNAYKFTLSVRHLQNKRNKMCFGVMVFAYATAYIRPTGI